MAFFADVNDEDVIATWVEGNNFFIGERNEVRPGPSMASAFSNFNDYFNSIEIQNLKKIVLTNFNTSNVSNMSSMFFITGIYSNNLTLNLGNQFNTSNVTNMAGIFQSTGRSSNVFTLNLNSFLINNISINLTNFENYSRVTNIIFGSGWSNANISQISFTYLKPINVYYTDSSFLTTNLGNMNYWNTWRGAGNTTFIAGLPTP